MPVKLTRKSRAHNPGSFNPRPYMRGDLRALDSLTTEEFQSTPLHEGRRL